MTRTLQTELKKKQPFQVPEEETFLNLVRTQSVLSAGLMRLFKEHGLSDPQYNILRILRGAGDPGLPCLEIGERMVTREPDVTRLLDRLEQAKLVARRRSTEDRRVVLVEITARGQALLAEIDEPLAAAHRALLGHLSRKEQVELNRLLVKARSGGEPS